MRWYVAPLAFMLPVLFASCGNKAELSVPGKPDPIEVPDASGAGGSTREAGMVVIINTGDSSIMVDPSAECEAGGCEAEVPNPAICGDGKINQADEKCDDGNTDSGDGCTANCRQLEDNFACPTPGQPCVSTVKCGDGKISAGVETCDDNNTAPGDGCSATCKVEPGFECEVAGMLCAAKCGDGIIAGDEQCEFYGGAVPTAGSGCTVDCQIEPGWDCNATTKTCAKTVCGNGMVENGEQCDDGAAVTIPFDGCYNCQSEPKCTAGACEAVCGDGKRYNSEDCDDGNNRDGDGCSKDCKVEKGYKCADVAAAQADTISLPVIYRDFIGMIRDDVPKRSAFAAAQAAAGVKVHPDFNQFFGAGITGVVAKSLGADGRPVYVMPNPGEPANFTGQANYDKWYRNDPVYNRVVLGTIDLARNGTVYVFDSGAFFGPVDGKGFNAAAPAPLPLDSNASRSPHNFSFTSETHFWFEYGGGEKFDFSGDDDVWVFVGGTLVVDLGGLHSKLSGGFTLDPTSGVAHAAYAEDPTKDGDVDLKLKIGSVYELVMFHAEREELNSNFKLTLKDFNKPKSACGPVCGDGIVTRTEVCDDGPGGNTGEYGKCMPGCKQRAPYCGDGQIQPEHEKCDDGVNLSAYGGCAPGCVLGPSCGDGIVQSAFEECDDGVLDGKYGGCAPQCRLAPHCGDGVVQADHEQCDDGNRINTDICSNACQFGMIQ